MDPTTVAIVSLLERLFGFFGPPGLFGGLVFLIGRWAVNVIRDWLVTNQGKQDEQAKEFADYRKQRENEFKEERARLMSEAAQERERAYDILMGVLRNNKAEMGLLVSAFQAQTEALLEVKVSVNGIGTELHEHATTVSGLPAQLETITGLLKESGRA